MSVLEHPAPSAAWSFVRGIAVGLILAAGGVGAFLVFSPAHLVFQRANSASPDATPPKTAADELDEGIDKVAAAHGIMADARMHRASRIYFSAFRSIHGSDKLALVFYDLAFKHYAEDQSVPFNDLLAEQLKTVHIMGSIGTPGPMPESFQEASRLLHEMDFE